MSILGLLEMSSFGGSCNIDNISMVKLDKLVHQLKSGLFSDFQVVNSIILQI
jgi:hypothetical protein